MSDIKADRQIDTSGKCCPMPIVDTNMAMKKASSGEILEIIATDPGTKTDIPSWCDRTGNILVESSEANGSIHYFIKKK